MTQKKPKVPLASLMNRKLEGLSESEAMQLIGSIIDVGGDEQSLAALNHADDLLNQFLENNVSDHHACRAHYFRANIWSAKHSISQDRQRWLWTSESIDGEVLELRKALSHPGFADLPPMERAQIYTNLGNVLSHVGRFIEAIEYWDRALADVPRFAMACGNRGLGLGHYAGALYDPGHRGVLMVFACEALAQSCAEDAILDSPDQGNAIDYFAKCMNDILSHYNMREIVEDIDLLNHPMGRGKRERGYRQWCLNNRLFINSLNDIGPNPIAAQDVMTLPSITVGIDEGPRPPAVIHYFNLIKQEFCASRYALYEGITSTGVHFSDRGVLLYNTLDYPAFGFAMERMKMAFRGAYAVFDKVAFLLNAYLDLGHPIRQVNFRNVWFKKGKEKKVHPIIDGLENWPLRGLFWLSKDIFENDFRGVTEPDARELYELRNHLEHKFVSVHDDVFRVISPHITRTPEVGMFDISVDDLVAKTLRQLKLARAAIIYMSLGIHAEERQRTAEHNGDKISVPMILDTWEDEWKRRD
jgi:tetratricopeptide (TPR) repeat protein